LINEYEAMQIKEIADLFLQRTPVRTIANMMTAKGYKHKYGEWEAKTVRRVLSADVTYGNIKHREQVYPGEHEAILDEASGEKIRAIMDERKKEFGSTRKDFKSLLGGMIYCAHCKGRYARRANGGGIFYYSCYSRNKSVKRMIKDPNCVNKTYRHEELDEAILGEIKKLAIDPAYVEEVRENKPENNVAEKAKTISAEIAKIDSQISKMLDLYALGTIDVDMINDKVADLSTTKSRLTAELDALAVPDEGEALTVKQIQTMAGLMKKAKTLLQQRDIIESLIHYIEIDNDDVIIHWKF
jgi:site-specific DNA recombinase